MLNSESSGIRDWTVWCILRVGLICLESKYVSSAWASRQCHRCETNRIRCSTSSSCRASTRSVLLSSITSAHATCLTLVSDLLTASEHVQDLLLTIVGFAFAGFDLAQLLSQSIRLRPRTVNTSETGTLTLSTFRQSTTQTTPSSIRSPISSFAQKLRAMGPTSS